MSTPHSKSAPAPVPSPDPNLDSPVGAAPAAARPREIGGPAGPEPTRFGDWEKNGRCIDF
jgi:hypothetical protein